jgi:hypothetical protein
MDVKLALTTIASAFAAVMLAACGSSSTTPALDLGTEQIIGQEFVQQRGCPDCHQSSNPADGILSGVTTPRPNTMAYPANLTPDVTTGLGAWADIEIIRAMRYGVDNAGVPLCPPMPHFDGSDPKQPMMTDVEANAIVSYLRALPPVKRAIPESACPQKVLHD